MGVYRGSVSAWGYPGSEFGSLTGVSTRLGSKWRTSFGRLPSPSRVLATRTDWVRSFASPVSGEPGRSAVSLDADYPVIARRAAVRAGAPEGEFATSVRFYIAK